MRIFIPNICNKNTWVIAASAGVWIILLALMRWILSASQKGSSSGAYALIFSFIGILVFIPSATFASIRPVPGDRVKDVMVVTAREADGEIIGVLRGISDLADEQKSKLEGISKGALRRYATRNVIRLLFSLMRAGVLERAG